MSLILLVEDVADNRALARYLLEAAGLEVVEAQTGQEALDLAATRRPDLILMDLQMPGMDGWEAARRLQADPATADIPVLAVTAHAMTGDRERVLAAGFAAYISKPIDLTNFVATVRAHLPA